MVQKVQIHLVDDLTGGEADETVRFGIDGTDYEIDLSADNAVKLREALDTYTATGRKVHGRGGGRARKATANSSHADGAQTGNREETQKIRRWAQENGHSTSSRGRISSEVRDAYNAAMQ